MFIKTKGIFGELYLIGICFINPYLVVNYNLHTKHCDRCRCHVQFAAEITVSNAMWDLASLMETFSWIPAYVYNIGLDSPQ